MSAGSSNHPSSNLYHSGYNALPSSRGNGYFVSQGSGWIAPSCPQQSLSDVRAAQSAIARSCVASFDHHSSTDLFHHDVNSNPSSVNTCNTDGNLPSMVGSLQSTISSGSNFSSMSAQYALFRSGSGDDMCAPPSAAHPAGLPGEAAYSLRTPSFTAMPAGPH
eukprot:CAMPEP_0113672114 /NCGR_PEP_ID=MMETSP0038_2-20120614/6080_1 /TAXON_ID=2898 /ORGANISM="Cryptomonas paramecium" /LENGTH=162 /DNA_ID=CAMNT_0000588341 /DNA_START=88 /DNA_END=573 /DNA_ORIENTATION=+ /assembly_acc=CAM_ASM_000170